MLSQEWRPEEGFPEGLSLKLRPADEVKISEAEMGRGLQAWVERQPAPSRKLVEVSASWVSGSRCCLTQCPLLIISIL